MEYITSRCNQCQKKIYGTRYRCVKCKDFDLCSKCINDDETGHPDHVFEKIRGPTITTRPFIKKKKGQENPSDSYTCDCCSMDITTVIFHCRECDDYDICHYCIDQAKYFHPGHHLDEIDRRDFSEKMEVSELSEKHDEDVESPLEKTEEPERTEGLERAQEFYSWRDAPLSGFGMNRSSSPSPTTTTRFAPLSNFGTSRVSSPSPPPRSRFTPLSDFAAGNYSAPSPPQASAASSSSRSPSPVRTRHAPLADFGTSRDSSPSPSRPTYSNVFSRSSTPSPVRTRHAPLADFGTSRDSSPSPSRPTYSNIFSRSSTPSPVRTRNAPLSGFGTTQSRSSTPSPARTYRAPSPERAVSPPPRTRAAPLSGFGNTPSRESSPSPIRTRHNPSPSPPLRTRQAPLSGFGGTGTGTKSRSSTPAPRIRTRKPSTHRSSTSPPKRTRNAPLANLGTSRGRSSTPAASVRARNPSTRRASPSPIINVTRIAPLAGFGTITRSPTRARKSSTRRSSTSPSTKKTRNAPLAGFGTSRNPSQPPKRTRKLPSRPSSPSPAQKKTRNAPLAGFGSPRGRSPPSPSTRRVPSPAPSTKTPNHPLSGLNSPTTNRFNIGKVAAKSPGKTRAAPLAGFRGPKSDQNDTPQTLPKTPISTPTTKANNPPKGTTPKNEPSGRPAPLAGFGPVGTRKPEEPKPKTPTTKPKNPPQGTPKTPNGSDNKPPIVILPPPKKPKNPTKGTKSNEKPQTRYAPLAGFGNPASNVPPKRTIKIELAKPFTITDQPPLSQTPVTPQAPIVKPPKTKKIEHTPPSDEEIPREDPRDTREKAPRGSQKDPRDRQRESRGSQKDPRNDPKESRGNHRDPRKKATSGDQREPQGRHRESRGSHRNFQDDPRDSGARESRGDKKITQDGRSKSRDRQRSESCAGSSRIGSKTPSRKKITRSSSNEQLDAGTCNHNPTNKLVVLGHVHKDLEKYIATSTGRRPGKLTDKQKKGFEEYKRWRKISADCGEVYTLDALVPVFDTLLFESSMEGRYTLRWVPVASMCSGLHGCCEYHPIKHPGYIRLSLWTQGDDDKLDPKVRMQMYMGVMVHEMSHGFLAIYNCMHCPNLRTMENVGKTGHAMAWQSVAGNCEKVCNDKGYLNVPLDCALKDSMGHEKKAQAGR